MADAAEQSLTSHGGSPCFSVNDLMCAKNIACGQSDAEEVTAMWMGSQGHRESILNPAYTTVGIGYFENKGTIMWTQCFGAGDATAIQRYLAGFLNVHDIGYLIE